MYESDDWTFFRTLDGIGQKAGIPLKLLPKLVAKELADNALDATGACSVGFLGSTGFYVEDDGDGIPGDDARVALMFSFRRPMLSTKRRLPTRGALGNGLRVVAGAIHASAGSLVVATGGRVLRLAPQFDGSTGVEALGHRERPGTRVEVRFGPAVALDAAALDWAREAIAMAGGGARYEGNPYPRWYDAASFHELLDSAKGMTVRDLVATFAGFSGKAGDIARPFGSGRLAPSLDRREAEILLATLRAEEGRARPFNLELLGGVGKGLPGFPTAYARAVGTFEVNRANPLGAVIPYAVEAWSEVSDQAGMAISVNRTPVAVELNAQYSKKALHVFGCGLHHQFDVGMKPQRVRLNIETPYIPKTNDGKTPDLTPTPLLNSIYAVMGAATRRAKNARRQPGGSPGGKLPTTKAAILACLPDAIAKAGGDGANIYSQRSLFYVVRDLIKDRYPGLEELKWKWFCGVITDHEDEIGHDLPKMYRDNRGVLYHPHGGDPIPLGTLNAERYRRPEWTFNKILYCEKEGIYPILEDARWLERHDCAFMTSKGFATRAARDVLDLLGRTGEPLTFFCIHDADASGTMIYQALQEGTKARDGRDFDVINLGLEAGDAIAMGFRVEAVERANHARLPVARYVAGLEDGAKWVEWYQSSRVELNAFTSPQLLDWLDRKFAPYSGKLIPPAAVLAGRLDRDVRDELTSAITVRVLREARLEEQVEAARAALDPVIRERVAELEEDVALDLDEDPAEPWTAPVGRIAAEIAEGVGQTDRESNAA